MKLRQLEIENYGIFSGRTFKFSGTGFQLIHGPNEAGKSTLLQLIREVFFGFPLRNPYVFPDHQGTMAATASIELSDGRKVSFRRRKGKKDVVVGHVEGTGTTVDEAALAAMLGQANANLYKHIFGFSLAELVKGQESLKDANISEALYGGGIGSLASFQQVQASLQREHKQLFLPGGKRTINELLTDIQTTGTELGKAMVKPRDYKELCRVRDEAEAAVTGLQEKRDASRRRFSQAQRLDKAFPLWQRFTEAEKELSALQVPDEIPYDAEKDYRRAVEAISKISGELAEEHESMAAARADLKKLRLEPRLTEDAAAAMVKSLEQDIGRIKKFRQDLPKRIQEAATIRRIQGETAARLNPEWDIAFLEKFTATSSQSEAVESIAQETRDLLRDQKNLESQIKGTKSKLAAETRRLGNLQLTTAAPLLAQLTGNDGQYKADCQALSETNAAIAEAAPKIDGLRRRLTAAIDVEAGSLDTIPAPLEAKTSEFATRFAETHRRLSQAKANLEAAQTDLSDYRQQLASADALQKVPNRRVLLETRRRRDADWEHIRHAFLEDQNIDDASKTELAEKFEQALTEADTLADQRQEKAQLVAAREQLAAKIERSENMFRELTNIHAAREAETESLTAQWHDVWAECRFEPDTPEVMRQWLGLHEKYCDHLREQKGRELKSEEMKNRTQTFEQQLREAMDNQSDSPQMLLKEARQQVERARDAGVARRHLENELMPSLRQEIDNLTADLDEIAKNQQHCRDRLQQTLTEIGFPSEWDALLADKVLKDLQKARGDLQEALTLDTRIDDIRKGILDYEIKVHNACESLSPELSELSDLPAEGAAAQLADRLDKASQSQNKHAALTRTIEVAQRHVKDKSTQQQSLQQEMQHMRETAGVDSDDEFYRVAADTRTKIDLQKEVENLSRVIKATAETEDIEAFYARLADADADSLGRELQTAKEELASAEKQCDQATIAVGGAREKLDALDSRSEAVDSAAAIEGHRAELHAAVDRWAPLVLAERLMSDAIDRFQREYQPAIYKIAARLFSDMTLGRYAVVRPRLDEEGTLLVESSAGGTKEPSQLSTGTREQLYLAIRLAYIRHYCRDAEPLPLVMDDVLVNFDDARAAETLNALIELSADLQVIFLTCHRQTANMIASRLPEMTPIELHV